MSYITAYYSKMKTKTKMKLSKSAASAR